MKILSYIFLISIMLIPINSNSSTNSINIKLIKDIVENLKRAESYRDEGKTARHEKIMQIAKKRIKSEFKPGKIFSTNDKYSFVKLNQNYLGEDTLGLSISDMDMVCFGVSSKTDMDIRIKLQDLKYGDTFKGKIIITDMYHFSIGFLSSYNIYITCKILSIKF